MYALTRNTIAVKKTSEQYWCIHEVLEALYTNCQSSDGLPEDPHSSRDRQTPIFRWNRRERWWIALRPNDESYQSIGDKGWLTMVVQRSTAVAVASKLENRVYRMESGKRESTSELRKPTN